MRIFNISTSDSLEGACQAVYRLHSALRLRGHDSRLFVSSKTSNDASVIPLTAPFDYPTRLKRRWRRLVFEKKQITGMPRLTQCADLYEMFSSCFSPYWHLTPQSLSEAEVIQLNWVSGFLGWPSFFAEVGNIRAPLVWRLADINP
jgi:hypothetical protein